MSRGFLEALEAAVREVPWREPVVVRVPGVGTGFGCRVCIAASGFRAQDVKELPQTRAEWREHFDSAHLADEAV